MHSAPLIRITAAPLPTPRIPDADDGGLGHDDILRIPQRSVLVQLPPWDGFQDGDTLAILVNDRIFGQTQVSATDNDTLVDVRVPATMFAPLADGEYEVFARVSNGLGLPVRSPVPLRVYFKLAVPGGHDPVADTPFRNENLKLPVVDPAIITPDTTSASVNIEPWENKAEGDRLILRWGLASNEQEHTVGAGEETQDYTFTVDRAFIDAGGFGRGINVNYQVYDRVGNWSLWSPPALVETEDPDALDPPWVDPTVDDAGQVIDLAALGTNEAVAQVFNLKVDDIVTVHFGGITAEGSAVEHTTEPKQATATGRPLTFLLPNALFPPLAQGTCAVAYTLERPGDTTYISARRRLEIHGELTALVPPSVAEAVGDTLDPAAVPDGATTLVEANPLIAPGSRVTLEMFGSTTGGTPVGHEAFRDISGGTSFPLNFIVPVQKIAALNGSTATFAYSVDTFDLALGRGVRHAIRPSALYPSPERRYRIMGTTADLPPPNVPAADGNRLDPDAIDARVGAQVDVTWPTIAVNDQVTLTWTGTKTEPYTDMLSVRGNSVAFFVPKTPDVTGNDGGDISVEYSVAFASGGSERSAARVLHVGSGPGELPAPTVDEAVAGRLDPIDALSGATVSLPDSVELQPADRTGVQFGTYETPLQNGEAGRSFRIPPSELGRFLGTTVDVRYTLVRDSVAYPSVPQPLIVLNFDDESPRLPAPAITQASGDRLDLDSFQGDGTVTVAPWPLIVVEQKAWLEASGTTKADAITTTRLLTASPITAGQVGAGLSVPLPRSWLDTLKDDTDVTLVLHVAFDGSPDKTAAVRFPLRAYRMVVVPVKILLEFEEVPYGQLAVGAKVSLGTNAAVLTCESGYVGGGLSPTDPGTPLHDSFVMLSCIPSGPPASARIDLRDEASSLQFGYVCATDTVAVVLYNAQGLIVGHMSMPVQITPSWIDYTTLVPFTRIDLKVHATPSSWASLWLDNMTLSNRPWSSDSASAQEQPESLDASWRNDLILPPLPEPSSE